MTVGVSVVAVPVSGRNSCLVAVSFGSGRAFQIKRPFVAPFTGTQVHCARTFLIQSTWWTFLHGPPMRGFEAASAGVNPPNAKAALVTTAARVRMAPVWAGRPAGSQSGLLESVGNWAFVRRARLKPCTPSDP